MAALLGIVHSTARQEQRQAPRGRALSGLELYNAYAMAAAEAAQLPIPAASPSPVQTSA